MFSSTLSSRFSSKLLNLYSIFRIFLKIIFLISPNVHLQFNIFWKILAVPENAVGDTTSWILIVLIVSVIFLTTLVAIICFILCKPPFLLKAEAVPNLTNVIDNRYQHRASGILRRKMLSGADLQLDRLRVASDSMMTEYNPNYEFGGVVYTLKDLKDIPREQLRLVK